MLEYDGRVYDKRGSESNCYNVRARFLKVNMNTLFIKFCNKEGNTIGFLARQEVHIKLLFEQNKSNNLKIVCPTAGRRPLQNVCLRNNIWFAGSRDLYLPKQ